MNERIRELAEQAGFTANDEQKVFLQVYEQELKRFAELIVQDCANYVDELSIHQQHFKGTLNVGNALRSRFGVKE